MKILYRLCSRNPASGLLQIGHKLEKMKMATQLTDIKLPSNFFDFIFFLLSCLVIGSSFMSISSLVLKFWQLFFIRDWPEIWKSEIPPSEFCPISGDCNKLWILNLAENPLIKCHWTLGYIFCHFWVNKWNQQAEKAKLPPPHIYTQIY